MRIKAGGKCDVDIALNSGGQLYGFVMRYDLYVGITY